MIVPAAPPSPDPPAPSLVGRDREQAALRDALAAALAGRGSLVLIGGEAGIGKTTLAEWLCTEASAQGALVLVGRCYDLAETPPYGPWAEALARAPRVDDLLSPPDFAGGGVASQAALFGAVRDYLAALAARRPVVLLLDDLHWADLASLDLLRSLARGLAELRILLLVTYRADELTRRHPLYQLLPVLGREARATRLDLRRLDAIALRALVGRYALAEADAGRLAAWLHLRAEGNAFFTAQLLRALEDEGTLRQSGDAWALGNLAEFGLPAPLRQVLDARLDRLGEGPRRLLTLAAVIGQEVPLALWATVAEIGEDVLLDTVERAVDAHLLDELPDGSGVRFPHALIREALYEGMLALRRRPVHRAAAEALAATPVPDPDAVAYHFQRAGDPRAAEWLIQAGERASRAFAYLTAAGRYQSALLLLGERGERACERGWLLHRLGRMFYRTDPARSLGYHDEAARAAAAVGDRVLAAIARTERGLALCALERYAQGLDELEPGLAAVASLAATDRARLAVLHADGAVPPVDAYRSSFALALVRAGHLAEAVTLAEQIVAQPAGKPRPGALHAASGIATAGIVLALAHAALGRPADALRAFARAHDAHRAIGHDLNVAHGAFFELLLVVVPYRADDMGERRRVGTEGERAWARVGDVVANAPARLAWLPILPIEGGWAEARARASAASGATMLAPFAAWAILGPLARAQGEADLAARIVREALPDGPTTKPGGTTFLPALPAQRLAAALALDAGHLPTAREWLEAHDRWLAWNGTVLGRAEGALGWATYQRAAGDLAQARAHAEHALAHATAPRQPLALLAAHRFLGELATADAQITDAQAHLDVALALADACAAPYERALTLLSLADLRAATGERDAAEATLTEARAILESLGALPALTRAAALAARLAAPAPAIAASPFGLTARESEVLRLVAEGLPDAEIAARLFLSRRTIHAHLRAVYGKLGVASRSAATRLAIEHNLA